MRRAAAIVAIVAVFGTAGGQVSFDGAVEGALLALDTGRVEESAALFDRAAEARPELAKRIAPQRAWAYVKLGNTALKERDYAGAERYFDNAASIYPGFRELVVERWAFSKLHQINEIINEASENRGEVNWEALAENTKWVIEAAPQNRQAYYTLGLIYDFQDKKEDAKRYYVRAVGRRNAVRNRSLPALREAANEAVSGTMYTFDLRPIYPPWKYYDAGDWQVIRRGPFVIYHRNEELAQRVGAVLEYWLERPALEGVLAAGGPFPEECKVYIYPDEESFKSSGGKEMWAGGQSKFTYRDDKLVSTTIHLYQTAIELMEGAVPHELAHVRFLAAAPYLEGLPLWVQEGVATSTETDYKKESLAAALSAAYESGGLMPFEQVMEAQTYPQDYASELFYGECLAAVEKLLERYGERRFRQYVEGAKSLGDFKALRAVYGLTPRQVEDLIVEWVDEKR